MNLQLSIVRYGPEHIEACADLWRASQSEMFPSLPPGPVRSFGEATEGEEVHVAINIHANMNKGKLLGLISLWRPQSFIHFLIVDGTSRRKGVGAALLDFATSHLPHPVELKCGSGNLTACAFYDRKGWYAAEHVEGADEPYILYKWPG